MSDSANPDGAQPDSPAPASTAAAGHAPRARAEEVLTAAERANQGGRVRRWLYAVRMLPRLQRRIDELEEAVLELRRVDRRTAELVDVVAEVLLPAVDRDEEVLRRKLDEYVKGL